MRVIALLSATLLAAVSQSCEQPQATLFEAREAVFHTAVPLSPDRLAAHVEYLASAELDGRFPGTEGIRLAERHIADRMSTAGLDPLTEDDGYFHHVTLHQSDYDETSTFVRARTNGTVIVEESASAIRPLPVTDFGSATAPLVFAGYGIVAPDYGWDDYHDLDVEGRIVVVLRYEPGAFDEASGFAGAELTDHSLFARKAQNARERGALGMILVTGPEHQSGPEDLRSQWTLALEPHSIARRYARSRMRRFLAVQVSQHFARSLLHPLGYDLSDVQLDLDAGVTAAELDLGVLSIDMSIEVQPQPRPIETRNVVGVLSANAPGARPESAGWVVIGAHHDHLGSFGDTTRKIYYGADDNASGVAAVLELAAHFAGETRDRNMAFVTFTAEEAGLLGSRAFVRDDVIPSEGIDLMINLDMIGRNPHQPVRITASESASEYVEMLVPAAGILDLEIDVRHGELRAVSDHYPFFEAGVPVLSFFTGRHADYHQVTDTAERLDYDRMSRIAQLVADVLAGRSIRETGSRNGRAP